MDIVGTASIATERAKELFQSTSGLLGRARTLVGGDAHFFSVAPKVDELRVALDESASSSKLSAMKRIVAQMCRGHDMHHMYPDVVKNVHHGSIELRKLVYLFLAHYAADCPDEALLSISAFQRDLTNPSMHVRSLALRMLTSLHIPAAHAVVMLAIKSATTDKAPIVRKTAAISLAEACASRKVEEKDNIVQLLRQLLTDEHPDVVSSAMMAYDRLCPDEWTLIHPIYRRLCSEVLATSEEWGQIVILTVLLRYARTHFTDPNGGGATNAASSRSDNHTSSSSSTSSDSDDDGRRDAMNMTEVDHDHRLLLNAAKPLLMSMNAAVVVAVCSIYIHAAPSSYQQWCVEPLMRCLACGHDCEYLVLLQVIHRLAQHEACRAALEPYLRTFFILPHDAREVREVKFTILALLSTRENFHALHAELRSYLRHHDPEQVVLAVRGLVMMYQRLEADFSAPIIRLVSPLFTHVHGKVVAEAVGLLRLLCARSTEAALTTKLVAKLLAAVMAGRITNSAAVITILWLSGEQISCSSSIAAGAPDCFLSFVRKFGELDDDGVKREVLMLGCKIWLHLDGSGEMVERFGKVYAYALELARFDASYRIREYARVLYCTLDRSSDATKALQACLELEQPTPEVAELCPGLHADVCLGSIAHVTGVTLPSHRALPPWSGEVLHRSLRGPPTTLQQSRRGLSSSSTQRSSSSTRSHSSFFGSTDEDDDEPSERAEQEAAARQFNANNSDSSPTGSSSQYEEESSTEGDDEGTSSSETDDEEVGTTAVGQQPPARKRFAITAQTRA